MIGELINPKVAVEWTEEMMWSEIPEKYRDQVSELSVKNPVRNTPWKYLKFTDSSVFSPAANEFLKSQEKCKGTGRTPVYTSALPGTKQYETYWLEQKRRCIEGYEPVIDGVPCGVRITGEHYFYLNFCRIQKAVKDKRTKEERKRLSFPDFCSMDFYWFLELERNENPEKYGLSYKDKRGMIVAKARRKGYSFKNAAGALWKYTFFPDSYVIIASFLSDYADATMKMALEMSNFLNEYTEFRHPRLVDRKDEIVSGYVEKVNGIEVKKGYKSTIKVMTFQQSAFKSAGKCFGEDTKVWMYDGTTKFIQDIKVGDLVMGPDSKPRKVLNVHTGLDDMYQIRPTVGDTYLVNSKHDLYLNNYYSGKCDIVETKDFNSLPKYMKENGYKQLKSDVIHYSETKTDIDPYYLGIWLGDGSSSNQKVTTIDKEIEDYIYKYAQSLGAYVNSYTKKGTKAKDLTISTKEKYNYLRDKLKPLFNNKHVPFEYLINSEKNRLELLAGLLDSDGYLSKNRFFEITQKSKQLFLDIKKLCDSLGFRTKWTIKTINGISYYRLIISGNLSRIPTKLKRKQSKYVGTDKHLKTTIKVLPIGKSKYYGFECDGDHLFLLDDGTIVHNSASRMIFEEAGLFENLKVAYTISEPLFRDGEKMIGIPIIFGTGGDMDGRTQDFAEMMRTPKQYGLAEYDNVYEYTNVSSKTGFFVDEMWFRPCEMVIEDKVWQGVDENGNANRWLAEINLDLERDEKQGSDKNAYNKLITQKCKTLSEAFLITEGNVFQVPELYARLQRLLNDDNYRYIGQTGWLVESDGIVRWQPDLKHELSPLNTYPTKRDQDLDGAIVIYEHPLEIGGGIPDDLYVIGHDPWGIDAVGGRSLGATYVLKTKKLGLMGYGHDQIVAEYVARPDPGGMAEYNYNLEKLALYYNAKINFENDRGEVRPYFTKKKRLHLLCPPPYTTIQRHLSNSNMAGRKFGYSMSSDKMKSIGEQYLYDWLGERRGFDEELGRDLTNMDFIPSKALLEELISYNRHGNFDRVLALIGAVIRLEEIHNPYVIEDPDQKHALEFLVNNNNLFKNASTLRKTETLVQREKER